MSKKYFLVYDDHTHNYYLEQLLNSVKNFGKDFEIIIFNKEDMDEKFVNENKEILEMKRGGGYWLWKPYIVNDLLSKIKEGDYLFYMDSSYYFTEDFTSLYDDFLPLCTFKSPISRRFTDDKGNGFRALEMCEDVKQNDFLIWVNKPNESTNHMKKLCKMDVIKKYNMEKKILLENVNEFWAGSFIIKKTQRTDILIKEWLIMCCNKHDITDEPSEIPNHPEFFEHRHDQSLLSIILHKNNIQGQVLEKKYLQNVRNPY